MPDLTILYDGWSLIHKPYSPEAMHLLALLAHLPPQVQPVVALPAPPPTWMPAVATHVHLLKGSSFDQLKWEQSILPHLVDELGARLLHLTSATPPLWGQPKSVVSPAGFPGEPPAVLTDRLREALAQGGLARVRALFWPQDLPIPIASTPIVKLPPLVHPGFNNTTAEEGSGPDLPETYVLYHGPTDLHSLQRLLAAWSWAAGPVGEYYPLLLLGLDGEARDRLSALLSESALRETVRPLPEVSPVEIPQLYQRCTALFHPAPASPWGDPLRHALACGRTVVALESSLASAMAGPAAYLVPENDERGLGAALITVIVEEEVHLQLSNAASQVVAGWQMADFGQQLYEAYRRVLEEG